MNDLIDTENGVMVKIVNAWQKSHTPDGYEPSEYYILLNTIIGFNKFSYRESYHNVDEYRIIVNFVQGAGINGINNYISVTKECYDNIVKLLLRK